MFVQTFAYRAFPNIYRFVLCIFYTLHFVKNATATKIPFNKFMDSLITVVLSSIRNLSSLNSAAMVSYYRVNSNFDIHYITRVYNYIVHMFIQVLLGGNLEHV